MNKFYLLLVLFTTNLNSQDIIPWSADYEITLQDFKSAETEISSELKFYSLSTGAQINFFYQMTVAEFMFTKNFNSKISAELNRNISVLTSPDSTSALQLVKFGNYDFDLTELYSRKLRKELYENKSAFTDPSALMDAYNKNQEKINAEHARVMKLTDLGSEKDLLEEEHQKVINQINDLAEFCKACKPKKKKKRRDKQ